jgi:hypothetical protein
LSVGCGSEGSVVVLPSPTIKAVILSGAQRSRRTCGCPCLCICGCRCRCACSYLCIFCSSLPQGICFSASPGTMAQPKASGRACFSLPIQTPTLPFRTKGPSTYAQAPKARHHPSPGHRPGSRVRKRCQGLKARFIPSPCRNLSRPSSSTSFSAPTHFPKPEVAKSCTGYYAS